MKNRLLALLLCCWAMNAWCGDFSIAGYWVVATGDAVIKVNVTDTVQIQLVSTRDPELRDIENPDQTLRQRLLAGIILGEGFEPGDDAWTGGRIYDPDSGKTYRATLALIDENHLKVHGYIGLPAFGKSQIWTRKALFESQINAMLAATENSND